MLIKKLTLQNFRCFTTLEVPFEGRCVVVQGKNGVGKSSVLEALHYSCYLKSFRTHVHKELIHLDSEHFFIKIETEQQKETTTDSISVGFSPEAGKIVKLNEKQIKSYRELVTNYRVVTLAADDLVLVHGAPDGRRDFLNYALFLFEPTHVVQFKRYKQILENRNSILQGIKNRTLRSYQEELEIWSQKLWEQSQIIRALRLEYLQNLERQVNYLLSTYFSKTDADLSIGFEYLDKGKHMTNTFDEFWACFSSSASVETEQQWGRSLFGIHLDDFTITFQQKRARVFASRGQQKLIVFLIKVAQLLELGLTGEPGVLLLDDFLTDFDDQRIQECFNALCNLPFQIILTCPTNTSVLEAGLSLSDKIGGFSIVGL